MVVNAPTSNIVSAAEHAIALLLATARQIPSRREPARGRSGSGTGSPASSSTARPSARRPRQDRAAVRPADGGVRHAADRLRPARFSGAGRQLGIELVELRTCCDGRHHHHPPAQDRRDAGPDRQGPARATEPGVLIVNAARGGLIDEQRWPRRCAAATSAARASTSSSPSRPRRSPLFELPHIVLTPHLGASTAEAQDSAGLDVARSVKLALAGDFVPGRGERAGSGKSARRCGPGCPGPQLGMMLQAIAGGVPNSVTVDVRRRAGRRGRLGAAAGRAARAVRQGRGGPGDLRERAGPCRGARCDGELTTAPESATTAASCSCARRSPTARR